MTKKEFLKLYKGKAVWCKTEELANEFLELADKFGFRWINGGEKLTSMNFWEFYKKNTTYIMRSNFDVSFENKITNYEIVEFNPLKITSTPQVTFDPPKTILTLKGKEFVSVAKDEPFDKEKGVLMCLAKANGFDYDKVSELVESAKKQMPKLTEAERVILENLPKEYKWIARDENDDIYLYKDKPYKEKIYKEKIYWYARNYMDKKIELFNHLFQFVKWSDDEPYEISKLLELK